MKTVYELLLPALVELGVGKVLGRTKDRDQQPSSEDDGSGDELPCERQVNVEEGVSHHQGAEEDHEVGGAHGGLSGLGGSGHDCKCCFKGDAGEVLATAGDGLTELRQRVDGPALGSAGVSAQVAGFACGAYKQGVTLDAHAAASKLPRQADQANLRRVAEADLDEPVRQLNEIDGVAHVSHCLELPTMTAHRVGHDSNRLRFGQLGPDRAPIGWPQVGALHAAFDGNLDGSTAINGHTTFNPVGQPLRRDLKAGCDSSNAAGLVDGLFQVHAYITRSVY